MGASPRLRTVINFWDLCALVWWILHHEDGPCFVSDSPGNSHFVRDIHCHVVMEFIGFSGTFI